MTGYKIWLISIDNNNCIVHLFVTRCDMSDVCLVFVVNSYRMVPLYILRITAYDLPPYETFESEFHALRWVLISNVIVTDIFEIELGYFPLKTRK